MKIEITQKNENTLLERTDLKGTINFKGVTPSNNDVVIGIASNLGVKENLIVVKAIHTQFSQQNGTFDAMVYKNTEVLKKTEKMTKHLRKIAKEEAKKVTEAKEAEKERKKTEEEAKKARSESSDEAQE